MPPAGSLPSASVATLEAALVARPGVDSVRVDGAWLTLLDDWTRRADAWLAPAIVATTVAVALLSGLVWSVAALAMKGFPAFAGRSPARAGAYIGGVGGVLTCAFSAALLVLGLKSFTGATVYDAVLTNTFSAAGPWLAGGACAVVVFSTIGAAVAWLLPIVTANRSDTF